MLYSIFFQFAIHRQEHASDIFVGGRCTRERNYLMQFYVEFYSFLFILISGRREFCKQMVHHAFERRRAMKYMKQFSIIMAISFLAEVIKEVLPLPIPASIYGLVGMLVCLLTGIIKLKDVEETADFLVEIMPFMFIPAAVGLLDSFDVLRPILLPVLVMIVVTTVIVMAVTGKVTQFVIEREKKKNE